MPVLDEAASLRPLHAELVRALDSLGVSWEVLYVDDGSRDEGPQVLAELARADARVRVITLARNYGQSTALVAGAEGGHGRWMATLDADGQNDPADLSALWEVVRRGEADAAVGVRVRRADSWVRRVSSRIANVVRDRVSGDRVTDVGCSLRVFPRAALLDAVRFDGMHRFLPTLLRMTGCTVVEVPVNHRPRRAGRSKYGIRNRVWRGAADLLVVRRLLRGRIEYRARDGGEAPVEPPAPSPGAAASRKEGPA